MPTHPESQRIRSNECNGWSTRGKKAGDRPKNRAKAVEATSSTRAKKPKLLLQVDSTGNALRKQLFNILKIKTLIKASWWCCQMDIQMKRTHTHTGKHTHFGHTRTTIYCTMAHYVTWSADQSRARKYYNRAQHDQKTFAHFYLHSPSVSTE